MKKSFFTTCFLWISFVAGYSQSLLYSEEIVGDTWYDLQSNNSCQNRLYLYDNGTIGAVWTRGMDYSSNYSDRGTGYNFYSGTNWQPLPEERIEPDRTGWPSYAPLGENGEIVCAHYSGADTMGLVFSKRENKGSGDWTETNMYGPPGHEGLLWPRMVTSGENHENIHLLALTNPEANGGTPYEGLNGALLYSLSTDKGETWIIINQILPGMDSTCYDGYYGDSYAFAEPRDSIVAFVVGSYAHDLFLMKSTDYGHTFTKTIIWDHPVDMIAPTTGTDIIFADDGSIDVEIDHAGMAHVVFGIISTWSDTYYNKWEVDKTVDGIGYWNENRPTFSSNVNALNPYGHPDSELVQDYSLIGYAQDIDGDGEITYLNNYFGYSTFGVSSMVQLVVDDLNRIFLVFTSITETYDNALMNYRRLWLRSSLDGGETWRKFYHFAENDPQSIYNEYAFPSCASNSNENIFLTAMIDWEPGIYMQPSEEASENDITFIKIPKDEVVGTEEHNKIRPVLCVEQNFPNPFTGSSTIKIFLPKPGLFKLEILDLTGQHVFSIRQQARSGWNRVMINANSLKPGLYFYTVTSGIKTITKKMIIQ